MIRRFTKRLFKKQTISQDEYSKIEQDALAAKELLDDERFAFFREYLENSQNSILKTFAENRITEVREELTISETLKRIFITPKKPQLDELSGQYKFISKLLDDLKTTSALKNEVEAALAKKSVVLDDEEEDGREDV